MTSFYDFYHKEDFDLQKICPKPVGKCEQNAQALRMSEENDVFDIKVDQLAIGNVSSVGDLQNPKSSIYPLPIY